MAIIIPSKHIYSKSFDPVIDNNIDKINIIATEIVSNNVYGDVVYREFVNYGQGTENQETSDMNERDLNDKNYGFSAANGYFRYRMNCGVMIRDKYFTFNISVPQKLKSYYITKVYQGSNPNTGEPYIAITKNFVETTYIEEVPNAYHGIGIGAAEVYAYLDPVVIEDYSYSNIVRKQQIGDIGNRAIIYFPDVNSDTNLNIGFFSSWTDVDISTLIQSENLASCTIMSDSLDKIMGATLKKDDFNVLETDLSQIHYTYENDNYVFYNVKVLFSREIFTAASLIFYKYSDDIADKEYPAKVVKLEQKTDRIEINIYGNALSIDLQDLDKSIGNGNKVFSFEGNELIQTTNTPSIESKYQRVIDEWKNGKQTAVITCPIADYYDTDGNKVIDTSVSGKMLFKEGNIVIPYTYTNKGDKPLSYNKNLTPKQFKVVGVKISKKQGGTQELTLQEI